jgi:benzoate transport
MTTDPRVAIKSGDMTPFQVIVVTLCVVIAALDGFDTLCIAYTAPSIAHDWSLGPASLGVVFSAGLVGMGLGCAFIVPIADKIGRRPIMLLALIIMAVGMLASAFAHNITELALWRVVTGIGIGTALASVNVIVAEYSSDKRRDLAVSLMTIGYPLGATIGGAVSIYLIDAYGWRSVYIFGSIVAIVLIPAALAWLPESIEFLVAGRPRNALETVNRIMTRMGHSPVQSLPATPISEGAPLFAIFRQPQLTSAVASAVTYFCVMFTVYFLLSWTPKLLTQLGFSIASGISGSLLMNLAGIVGCLLYGFYATQAGARNLAAIFTVGLFVATVNFGFISRDPVLLVSSTIFIGFCLFTVVTTLYVVTVVAIPPALRSTGIGFAMSVGRIGAFLGPFVGGLLIADGWTREAYCFVMALPTLLAAISLYWVGTAKTTGTTFSAELSRPN